VTLPVLSGVLPDGRPDPDVAARVARAWLGGALVGLPTETVYGLAADAQDPQAVARIFRVKGRPTDHPLIVHVAGAAALPAWSAGDDTAAVRLAGAFWPGPLTLVVRRSSRAGDLVTGGQDTVALRCPGHVVAHACIAALARASGDPARGVAAPSANRFGRVSPTRAADVVAELGRWLDPGRDLVVDGGPSAVGVESTIVDCTADPPRVLRLGAISQAEVDAVLAQAAATPARAPGSSRAAPAPGSRPSLAHDPFGLGGQERAEPEWIMPRGEGAPVRAPGSLDSHYAPQALVVLVERPVDGRPLQAQIVERPVDGRPLQAQVVERPVDGRPLPAQAGVGGAVGLIADDDVATPEGWARLAAPASPEEYARALYAALRRADVLGLAVVVAVLPDPSGGALALAVRDRLTRAAHPA
jgi:L-threonylcarbamoyladenylate synthase